jgi:hypothetical protein
MDKLITWTKTANPRRRLGMNWFRANGKYTFKENKALVNQLPARIWRFIQLVDAGQVWFKIQNTYFVVQFLGGIIPAAYTASLDNVKTTGDFTATGFAKDYTLTLLFLFNVDIKSNNASFLNTLIYQNQFKILYWY